MKVTVPAVQRLSRPGQKADVLYYIQVIQRTASWKTLKDIEALRDQLEKNSNEDPAALSFPSSDELEQLMSTDMRKSMEATLTGLLPHNTCVKKFLSNFEEVNPILEDANKLKTDKKLAAIRYLLAFLGARFKATYARGLNRDIGRVRNTVGYVIATIFVLNVTIRFVASDRIKSFLTFIFAAGCGATGTIALLENTVRTHSSAAIKNCKSLQESFDDASSLSRSNEEDVLQWALKRLLQLGIGTASIEKEQEEPELSDEELSSITKIDELDEKAEYQEAYKETLALIETYEEVIPFDILWRHVRQSFNYYEFGGLEKEEGKKLLESAYHQGKELIDRCPDSATSHKWYAIVCGEFKSKLGTKDKIEGGFIFQKHALRALELDDSDPTLHYMMGKFCYAVAGLSYFERKGAKAMFGTEPPNSTYDDALKFFEDCVERRADPYAYDFLEMARCCAKLNRKSEAVRHANKCIEVAKNDDPSDQKAKAGAGRLLNKL